MKIAFVLDDGLDKPDGVQQNILTLGDWLKSQGHQASYIVGETTRRDIESVLAVSRNLKVNFNGNRLSVPIISSSKKIKAALAEHDFDVVHVQIPYSPLMAARLIRRLPKKVALVGTFHILPTSQLSFFGTKLLGLALSGNLSRFDKQLAVSAPAAEFAAKTFNINCQILPNPVLLEKYKPKTKHATNKVIKIVFLGRLVSRKGCQYLLKAIKIINENNPEIEFQADICGDGQLKSQLKNYVDSNGIGDIVKFHGFVEEGEKIKFLQQADIAVFPSTGGESFGIVLVEAMAAGAVVLAGDNTGYHSVLGEVSDSLVDPKDSLKFSFILQKLIESKTVRAKIYKSQQKLVQQFDVNIVGQRLVNIYNDAIASHE